MSYFLKFKKTVKRYRQAAVSSQMFFEYGYQDQPDTHFPSVALHKSFVVLFLPAVVEEYFKFMDIAFVYYPAQHTALICQIDESYLLPKEDNFPQFLQKIFFQ